MIQIFIKTSQISAEDWQKAYARIEQIVVQFPLRLTRLEAYDGYTRKLSKEHTDVYENKDTDQESISFWGDTESYFVAHTIKFYKYWEVQKIKLHDKELDLSKPITWSNTENSIHDGLLPDANGQRFTSYYIESGNACYRFAIMAIGTMLENELPGRAFMIAYEYPKEEGEHVAQWLRVIFNEPYDVALYFDKHKLLDSFIDHYNDKTDAVQRFDRLYYKQVKQNMEFAIANIGFEPSLQFYARSLSQTLFGTWGFSDILNPWIACCRNLESVLRFIDHSKAALLTDANNTRNIDEANKYDFRKILDTMLNHRILWTPEQRDILRFLPNSDEELETNKKDLWSIFTRMSGLRVEICPMYANKQQLFEAFMYHDPSHGAEYMQMIDNWIANAENDYESIVKKIEAIKQSVPDEKLKNIDKEEQELIELEARIQQYIAQFPAQEQYFRGMAAAKNPACMDPQAAINKLLAKYCELRDKNKEHNNLAVFTQFSNERLKEEIWFKIKERGILYPGSDFETQLENETNTKILAVLLDLLYLRLYDTSAAYARTLFYRNNLHWHYLINI